MSVGVGWAGLGTAGAPAAGGAEAGAAHGVTGGSGDTVTDATAIQSEEARRAGTFTEGSPPAGRAGASPADVVTGCPVLTLAPPPAARPKVALGTPLLAPRARVAGLTRTQATDRIATPVAYTAAAGVAAVGSPVAAVAGSLAAEAGPPRGTAATSGHRVAVPVIGTGAPHLAAGPKPARRARVLAAAACVAGAAQAGSGPGLADGTVLTRRADLLAAQPPAAFGTICPTIVPSPPWRALALPRDPVAGCPPTGAGARAVHTERPLRALLVTVLPPVAGGTPLPTLAADGVTGHALRAGTCLQAPGPEEAWLALVLTPLAPEARFAGTAAVSPVARKRVPLFALTLLRAARPEGPRRTGQVAETAVEPRVAEAGPVEAVAPATIGTVALLVTLLAVEALGAAVLTVGSRDARGAAAGPRHGVAGPPVLTAAGRATVPPKCVWGTSLVADEPGPALRAVTAVQAREAGGPVPAVITGETAVLAEGGVQAHELLQQCVLAPGLHRCCLLLGPHVVILEEVGQLVLEHRDVWEGPHEGQLAVQVCLGYLQGGTASTVLVQPEAGLTGALEGAGQVGAVVLTAAAAGRALVHVLAAAAVGAEPVAGVAATLVPAGAVAADLLTARRVRTVVHVDARLLVLVQLVATGAAAQGPRTAVAAAVGAAPVAGLTAVHDLHLDPVALSAISAQLVAGVAHALIGPPGVEAAVGTPRLPCGTFVHIFAGPAVRPQQEARVAFTVGEPPAHLARVSAAAVPVRARVSPDTAFPVLLELEVGAALAAVLGHRELDTLVLAAAIPQGTRVDGQTGPAIRVEPESGLALTDVGAWRVHTAVLAAAIVHLALIHIVLTAGTLEPSGTAAQLD